MKTIRLLLVSLLFAYSLPLFAQSPEAISDVPSAAAIASAHPYATRAGHEILETGGNAFDAAVAVSAVLAVVEPYSSGLGGGGFWLLHRASDNHEVMVDGRERAPLSAHRDMYLDKQGEVIPGLSMDGPLAAGIPGEPAALAHIAEKYGRLPLAKSLAPAIRHAREGFPVTEHYRRMAGFRLEALRASPESAKVFLKDNEVPPLEHLIIQSDLANTLELMAKNGARGFYRGKVGKALVKGVRKNGGIWKKRDLKQYKVIEREPLKAPYLGMTVTSVAPPSSGGVALLSILNILEPYDLSQMEETSRVHLIIEAMRRAYRDRAEYLGDTDYVDVPVSRLIDPEYAADLRASINPEQATKSSELRGVQTEEGGNDTTHFSILDKQGNYVAATLSINYPFGSGFMPVGTGILLNDEMDDFSAKPGVANAYGLVGAEANAIAPGKRMLSSMSPTFVSNGERLAILGTPGGSRIITMVLLGILDFAAGNDPESWVSLPRFHHQYLPDTVFHEPGALTAQQVQALEQRGHTLKASDSPWGNMQAILWDKKYNEVQAASDPRVEGSAQVR